MLFRSKGAEILILGFTFKENCPDVRNTKVIDLISSLKEYGSIVKVFDPWANKAEVLDEYNLKINNKLIDKKFDAIVLAVSHDEFLKIDFSQIKNEKTVIYDVKNLLPLNLKHKTL